MTVDETLRGAGPVTRVGLPDGVTAWLVTGYDDARQALADPRLSRASAEAISTLSSLPPRVISAVRHNMLRSDPPDHTRLRRLVAAAFTVRRVQSLRPRIEEIAEGLLDAMAGAGEVDLTAAYASPLLLSERERWERLPEDRSLSWRTGILVYGVTGLPVTGV
jgi:cytochrome P450